MSLALDPIIILGSSPKNGLVKSYFLENGGELFFAQLKAFKMVV